MLNVLHVGDLLHLKMEFNYIKLQFSPLLPLGSKYLRHFRLVNNIQFGHIRKDIDGRLCWFIQRSCSGEDVNTFWEVGCVQVFALKQQQKLCILHSRNTYGEVCKKGSFIFDSMLATTQISGSHCDLLIRREKYWTCMVPAQTAPLFPYIQNVVHWWGPSNASPILELYYHSEWKCEGEHSF